MAQVAIDRCRVTETTPQGLLDQTRTVTETIRQRAYDLFRHRDGGSGSDLDDWLRAELDTTWVPVFELLERGKDFQLQVSLPGVEARDIQVSAFRDALIVRAEAAHTHEGKSDGVCFCGRAEKMLFRRLELPAPINVDKVSASLNKGVLQVTAPKLARKVASASAF